MAGFSLSVPLKISTEYDYAGITNQFLKSPESDSAVTELTKLRNTFISKNTSKSQSTLESLYRYHDQLASLSKKLPILSAQEIFSFTWQDALEKGSLFAEKHKVVSSSIEFEKSCILFNIAALQSRLGSECSDTDDELKTAAKLFQSSAGIFNELSAVKFQNMLKDDQALTSDLNADTLSALSALMLAQAQEAFVTKAIKDTMKDAIIAKLSVQAVDLYSDALSKMTKDTVKHLWDRTWLPNVAAKQTGYEALSNFFQSQVCAVNKRIGEQISRLNVCLKILKKAQEKIGNSEFLAYYVNEGTRLKAEAQKDNDFIYHEPIPESANLPTIARVPTARLAKLLPIPDSFSASFTDSFEKCELNSSPVATPQQLNPSTPVTPQVALEPEVVAKVITPTPGPRPPRPPEPEVVTKVITPTPGPRPPRPPPPQVPHTPIQKTVVPEPNPSPSPPANSPNAANAASPTLTDILNTSAGAVGNYLHNYLFGQRRQQ